MAFGFFLIGLAECLVCEVDAFPFLLIWEFFFLVCVELDLGLGFFGLWVLPFLFCLVLALDFIWPLEDGVCFLGQPFGFDRCLFWCEAVEFAEEDL